MTVFDTGWSLERTIDSMGKSVDSICLDTSHLLITTARDGLKLKLRGSQRLLFTLGADDSAQQQFTFSQHQKKKTPDNQT